MRGMTVRRAANACGGTYFGPAELLDFELSGIVTDSRVASPGCLFIAMRGEKSDGAQFAPTAAEKGAVCTVCQSPLDESLPHIAVENDLDALQAIAADYRRDFSYPFLGITGSVGKTTVKEMVAAVLSAKLRVYKTEKNNNSKIGVPHTMFRLDPEAQVGVIEMGISMIGEMERISRIVRPDMALFTAIADAHLEYLGDRPGVLRAKASMLEYVPKDGTVFINGDDELLRGLACAQKTISYGLGEDCDVRGVDIRREADCMYCDILASGRRIPVRIPAFGMHMVSAALAGAAVGIEFGLSDDDIARGVGMFRTVGSRDRLVETGYITLMDDCYNSNPCSAASALSSLACLSGRKVCILGDMRELGPESPRLHYETGAFAAAKGAALVLAVGPESEPLFRGAADAGGEARYFPTTAELITALPGLIRRGDCVLVKGSRGMRLENVVLVLEKLY